ncbi:hypothetical protein BDD12DRAFT_704588, partial [Trichophaea hybrida]
PFVDPYELHQPDNLHVIYLGMFKHLMEWIEEFLHRYQRRTEFDLVWQTIPSYPGFSHPSKPYRQITQFQGKDMRNIGRIIYPALAAALWNPQPRHRDIFHRAIACVRAMACFSLMAQYRAHDQATIEYLRLYLEEFHRSKDAVDEIIYAGSNFDFVKIHLLCHYEHAIRMTGELVQQSTKYAELNHPTQAKDPFSRSNK